jgi:hypothetical protein
MAIGSRITAARAVRPSTSIAGVISATATRMNRYGDAPDDRHQAEQHNPASRHAGRLQYTVTHPILADSAGLM